MTEVVFWFAAVAALLFPVVYAAVAPWWRTPVGRHEMSLGLMLALLFVLGILGRTLGPEHAVSHAMRVFAFFAVATVLWWRLILLVRVQVAARWRKARR